MAQSGFTKASVALSAAAVLGGALVILFSTAARAESVKDLAPPNDAVCEAYGPGFVAVGSSGLCARVGGGLLVSASKEFTDRDIVMLGQRIPVLFDGGAGVPMVYYHEESVRPQTRYPSAQAIASADMMLRAKSDLGLLRAFVRITADSRTHYDDDGGIGIDMRKVDDSYYVGAIEEAWAQWNGLKIGVQPSLFGFNRLPSVVTPGYTSIVTTLAASYTERLTPNLSVSISAEDSGRRLMGEGVLARPTRSDVPDVVVMMRWARPSTLFHFSAAMHQSDDRVLKDFIGGEEKSVRGWAWSAGLQSRVMWEEYLGDAGRGLIGRAGLTVANAYGALSYLGIPLFAPDYLVGSDGTIHRSSGWSALASYEHMLTPTMKLSLNASFFSVTMRSENEEIMPPVNDGGPAPPSLDFEVDVRGAVLQAGIEYMPMHGLTLGLEGGYTFTEAQGRYVGVAGDKISVGFPHVGVYLRKSF